MLNLVYAGCNRMPVMPTFPGKWSYSEGPIAFDPTTGELVVMGASNLKYACRIRPVKGSFLQSSNTSVANVATATSGWFDPSAGGYQKLADDQKALWSAANPGKTPPNLDFTVRGMSIDPSGTLHGVLWQFYNVTGSDYPYLFSVPKGGVLSGPVNPGVGALRAGRYCATGPDGTLYFGSSEVKDRKFSNYGPSCYRLNADGTVTTLLDWPADQPPFTWPYPNSTVMIPNKDTGVPEVGVNDKFHYRINTNVALLGPDPVPAPIEFSGWDRINGMAVCGDAVVYALTKAIGAKWYGDGLATDGHSALCNRVPTGGRGYCCEGVTTSLLVFPNAITSNGADRSWYELPLHSHLSRDIGTHTMTTDHINRKLYILEGTGDVTTFGPMLHIFTF